MSLVESWLRSVSRGILWVGKMGVRFSKWGRSRACSGSMPLISSTRTRLRYLSPSLGSRTWPETSSPGRRPNLRIWDWET